MTTAPPRRPRHSALERAWTPEDSAELYQLEAWGKGYLASNEAGHMVVRPGKRAGAEIDLLEVVEHLSERGAHAPVVLRFSDLLSHRLREMHDAFAAAIAENEYGGHFVAVYPVKVNQQRSVVEGVYRSGAAYGFGLEVGSKPELLAVMAMDDDGRRLVVCNGFKDDDYLETVVLAAKLGRSIVPVVEKLDELFLLLEHAAAHGVRPRIGVRVKLASPGAGRWSGSAGAKSKFGLFPSEVLELLRELEQRGMADCLELVHCHVGSQLHDIRRIKDAVGELAHVYAELVRLGATGLRYLDVGGGLGVDYDGSRTNFPSSMNYTLEEYAGEIVYRVASVCEDTGVAHPTLVTESGRATTAYQSLLVVNVLGRSGLDGFRVDEDLEELAEADLPQPILDLVDAARSLTQRRVVECFHDAVQAHEQALNLFSLGYLTLEWRAFAERLFWRTCALIRDLSRRLPSVPEELEKLDAILADTYFCNFSLFQSLPDAWAIDQLFPIAPIHRLDEKPARRAVLADVTCDSDGKLDRFIHRRDIERTLAVHDLIPGEPYYLAIFLVGAYQETLGGLHNLFGDTHVAHLRLEKGGAWLVEELVEGDTAAEVLSYLQYDVDELAVRLRASCERAVSEGKMGEAEAGRLLEHYNAGLHGYTYLEPGSAL